MTNQFQPPHSTDDATQPYAQPAEGSGYGSAPAGYGGSHGDSAGVAGYGSAGYGSAPAGGTGYGGAEYGHPQSYAQPGYAQPSYAAQPGYVQTRPNNTFAMISLILALVGIPSGGATSIPAIIFGHIARSQIKRTGEGGEQMALWGLIVGYGVLGLAVLLTVGYILLLIFVFGGLYTTGQMSS